MNTPVLALMAEGGFNPLAFDPSALVLTIVTFFALLAILAKFAWKPILEAAESREKRIEEAIRKSEEDRAEALRVLDEHRKTVANVETEVAALREQGRQDAEAMRREIRAKAHVEASEIAAKAQREIELAKNQALQDIRREAVSLGLAVAGTVVGRSLDGEDQKRIAEQVVAGMSDVGSGEA